MRFFLLCLLTFGHLLFLVIPSSARESTGTDADSNGKEVVKGSDAAVRAETDFWASLSPYHIIEDMQNALPPPPVQLMSLAKTPDVPEWPFTSGSDFWEEAKQYERTLQDYVPRLLKTASDYFQSTKFTDITSTMDNIVRSTTIFRKSIQSTLDAHDITLEALTKELEDICMTILHDIQNIPPPSTAPGHAEREETVNKILDSVDSALVEFAARHDIGTEVVMGYLRVLGPEVRALVVAVGDINEQHPELLPALAFSVTVMLIPESWILRPFLSMFGFGPEGPVKGSAAAWIQRRFWGEAVKAGSWFSWLQRAGMGGIPEWAGTVIKAPLAVGGGLLAAKLPFFKHVAT